MKKLVASIATGVIIAGVTFTSVSAEEYKVKKGDNLWDIAEKYDTTVDELVEINELKTTVIQPKQKLFINETYMVEKGDTLIGISKEYDVSVKDLKKWNNLNSDLIVIGQELEIKGVNVEQENKPAATIEKETSSNESSSNETAQSSKKENKSDNSPDGKTISVTATAYTADCDGCSGITSTGIDLNANPNAKVIAVDPNVIPLGSEVYVEGYGYATAADVGGAIDGNRIDIHVPTKSEAYDWGRRTVDVTIVN
ncbi:3D domain-containing protein [Virgibacillus doumboii]|uniref:3D domain-containing protein n=1 Tax=Virgibacillus doumboii TaxID=2697503 RepID=UPI0013E032D6|nr:3D domain-containing protein [Virgibacillus doumboii]